MKNRHKDISPGNYSKTEIMISLHLKIVMNEPQILIYTYISSSFLEHILYSFNSILLTDIPNINSCIQCKNLIISLSGCIEEYGILQ